MGLIGNFGGLTLDANGFLTVTGVSSGLTGYELVSRDVAVHQNDLLITHGAAKNVGPTDIQAENPPPTQWTTAPLAAAEFQAGEAVALGFETYFSAGNGHLPTYMTFTWSQIVTIT